MTTTPHPPSAIRLRGVTKTFGSVAAVAGLDLDLRPGEVVAFLGPNGAGKTTTIDMVLGLTRPTTGTVEILGMTPRAAIGRGLVAAVMQSGGLLEDLTVKETVAYTASLFPRHRPVDQVLADAGITDLARRKVRACSGGEKQRLRFAMALLGDPALLLLDEPTTGMDVEGRRAFWGAVRRDAARGRTVMFATHYLEEADQYADRIVLVSQGRVVADGTSAEIRALSAGRSVRASLPETLSGTDVDVEIDRLSRLPEVESVEARGHVLLIGSRDSDAVARHLLSRTGAHDLEITSHGLEDAFVRLTARPDQLPQPDHDLQGAAR